MITGKYLENPALYSPDELERLDNHIEKYFGKATTVVHEFFSEDIMLMSPSFRPMRNNNYYIFGNHRHGCVFDEDPK